MSTSTTPAPEVATERRAPRILVVDDERSMREMLAILLKREGYEVPLAENGKSAVTPRGEPVDILISDIKMPDISGVEVLRAAKRIDKDILGIMITAFASTESAVEAMRLEGLRLSTSPSISTCCG
jgi:two-component system response regulator PilR (NtrC family)